MAAVVAGLLGAAKAGAVPVAIDNLATTYGSSGDALESAKNATSTDYSQGFTVPTGDSGYIDGLTLDLTVKATSYGDNVNAAGADTLSIYLYSASSSTGDPLDTTPLVTFVTGLTQQDIETGTLLTYGSAGSVDSDFYAYTVNLAGISQYLTAGDTYAIQVDVSSGSQSVGWAENNDPFNSTYEPWQINPNPTDEDPYGAMEILTSIDPPGVPDSASTMLLLGGALAAVALMRRKTARLRPVSQGLA